MDDAPEVTPAQGEDCGGKYEPGESVKHDVDTAELEWNLLSILGHSMTHQNSGEELDEGGDDDVGGSEGGEHDVVQVPSEDGAVLDGDQDDDIEDSAQNAEAEVCGCKDSSSCDVVNTEIVSEIHFPENNFILGLFIDLLSRTIVTATQNDMIQRK